MASPAPLLIFPLLILDKKHIFSFRVVYGFSIILATRQDQVAFSNTTKNLCKGLNPEPTAKLNALIQQATAESVILIFVYIKVNVVMVPVKGP